MFGIGLIAPSQLTGTAVVDDAAAYEKWGKGQGQGAGEVGQGEALTHLCEAAPNLCPEPGTNADRPIPSISDYVRAALHTPAAVDRLRLSMCFAFVVVTPSVAEAELLRTMIVTLHILEPFGGRAIYSNTSRLPGPPLPILVTHVINGSMATAKEGRAVLSPFIFEQCWRHVLGVERAQQRYSWLLKIDADTVLLPCRLWPLLARHGSPRATPVLLTNSHGPQCAKDESGPCALHGAIEVMSSAAGALLEGALPMCPALWAEAVNRSGGAKRSEDALLYFCARMAGVAIHGEPRLLNDRSDRSGCGSAISAAYHPIKSAYSFRHCWHAAHVNSPASYRRGCWERSEYEAVLLPPIVKHRS